MYCKDCGKEIPENGNFCPGCGTRIEVVKKEEQYIQSANNEKKEGWISKGIKFVIGIFIALIAIGWIVDFFSTDYVELVKQSRLINYDYGKDIGDALDNWFEGNANWDSYEDNGNIYVIARGNCPYYTDSFNSSQKFVFRIQDDEHFVFIAAYDGSGNEIFTQSRDSRENLYMDMLSGLADIYGIDISMYEIGIRAAFGDQESLERLQHKELDNEM